MKYLIYVFYFEILINFASGGQSLFMPAAFLGQFSSQPAPAFALEMTRWYGVLIAVLTYLLIRGLMLRGTTLKVALEALLFNCVRHGPSSQNHASIDDFRAHLAGRVAHADLRRRRVLGGSEPGRGERQGHDRAGRRGAQVISPAGGRRKGPTSPSPAAAFWDFVIASEAKQSRAVYATLDCRVASLLAITTLHFARR